MKQLLHILALVIPKENSSYLILYILSIQNKGKKSKVLYNISFQYSS